MFYKLVEREANNHLNVPIVSSVSVCGLFYKQLSLLERGKAVLKMKYSFVPCSIHYMAVSLSSLVESSFPALQFFFLLL